MIDGAGPGQVPGRDLVERITPSGLTSLRDGRTEISDMVVGHAKLTAERLLESYPVIAAACTILPPPWSVSRTSSQKAAPSW
ncbi:carbonic anhydrase [Arthrobacter sp. Hiyo6]|jgi:carbonic anhydrase|nr:carbonic anhydrase [Arthrobacter sp. Hiyo6]